MIITFFLSQPKRIVIEDSLRESSLPREYPKHMKDIPDISQLLKVGITQTLFILANHY